jgi:hypothetical protein
MRERTHFSTGKIRKWILNPNTFFIESPEAKCYNQTGDRYAKTGKKLKR